MTQSKDILAIVADGLRAEKDPHAILDDMWAVLDQMPGADAEAALNAVLPKINELTDQIASDARVSGDAHRTTRVEMEPALFEAIEDGDIDGIRAGLAAWDVNRPFGKYEKTPLYAAMSNMFGASLEAMTCPSRCRRGSARGADGKQRAPRARLRGA